MSEDDKSFQELVQFLAPTSPLQLRRGALEIVTGISAALDGSAGQFFQKSDFALGKAICELCEATASDRTQTFTALTNFASGSIESAEYVLKQSKCVEIAYTSMVANAVYSSVASRLLANISRHFPDRIDEKLKLRNVEYLSILLGQIKNSIDGGDEDRAKFTGFIIVNLTVLQPIRRNILDSQKSTLSLICDILATAKTPEIRECAADILRNLAFDDDVHPILLDQSDEYLCAILAPLMDLNDNLDDDEMSKLPIRLQYYDKERERSEIVRQKLVEALFQLCATKHGREHLRQKGVYPAMRELDKSGEAQNAGPDSKKARTLLSSQEEHTLHALIGILIRYEDEMDVDPSLATIRHLGQA
ncbi:unnamed protein product [Caenorhabditis angaria]|uniref:Protein HGH1 homolog n=1 Tax=Caenorhabditis angaria TaxID=860376 RepID=A0A9P1MXQ1_9PELO|nr:unnamed protein product [Caenorhabditis angaria]